jgi:RNA polymerase sigma factor (sigma-70 family)
VAPAVTGQSFDDVYRESRPRLCRLAYLIVGSRSVAEELVQEAFLRLHQRFSDVENPGGYLRVSLVRLCSDTNRRAAMERERAIRAADPVARAAPEIDETWAAVQRLRPERRTVLVLRYYEDLPHDEIARLLGCPTVTVRTRVRRALADLRRELEQ